jgi:hypothetical protein
MPACLVGGTFEFLQCGSSCRFRHSAAGIRATKGGRRCLVCVLYVSCMVISVAKDIVTSRQMSLSIVSTAHCNLKVPRYSAIVDSLES